MKQDTKKGTVDYVPRGALKLKGKVITKNKKVIPISQPESESTDVIAIQEPTQQSAEVVVDSSKLTLEQRIAKVKNNPLLTPSEKAFKIAQIKRSATRVDKMLAETHRQRVEKFNDKLRKLSEHFDIPKVGPG